MNQDIKARWTKALRSGEFGQITGALNKIPTIYDEKEGFCCLGVLCEIAVEDGIIERIKYDNLGDVGYVPLGGKAADGYVEFAVLPVAVQEWAGLTSGNGEYSEGNDFGGPVRRTLVGANDDLRLSFSEIADIVDKHF